MARVGIRLLVSVLTILLCLALLAVSVAAQRNVGACCESDGDCTITSEALCEEKGGYFQGVNTTCTSCPSCDDENPCTEDSFNGEICVHEPLDCDDGNPCTTDSCVGGVCKNELLDCDDGDPCTSDLCYLGECGHEEIVCDDGNACTTDTCVGGDCVYEPLDCSDGDACTTDSCDNGDCVNEPLDCDDTNPCTTDSCFAGRCSNDPVVCDDSNACTTDTCVDGDCVYEPLNCDDDDPCTTDSCSDGSCVNAAKDCDDGNDRTEDSCNQGICVYTLVQAPASPSDEPEDPSVWFIDEAPWGEEEKQIHNALCAAAAVAGVKVRALTYSGGDVGFIERLLTGLAEARKPVLVLGSRETIQRIDPQIGARIPFFDTEGLRLLINTDSHNPVVGIPGQQQDWGLAEGGDGSPNEGTAPIDNGTWDPTQLPDPLAALDRLAELQTAEPVLAEFELPNGVTCQLVVDPSLANGEANTLLKLSCTGDENIVPEIVSPNSSSAGAAESYVATSESDLRTQLIRWFLRSYGLNADEDETWQRISSGSPLAEDEFAIVDAFREWLTAIGHTDAAELIAQGSAFPESSLGYAARFLWLRERLRQMNPVGTPWWQALLERREALAEGLEETDRAPLFLILAHIDPATGELSIDLVRD